MARKKRTKNPSKRTIRGRSDSDPNSNGVSDDTDGPSRQESGSDEKYDSSQKIENTDEDSKADSLSEESHTNPSTERNHKHPKFRYLERKHSNDEDSESTTCDLTPQQNQNTVVEEDKDDIISQDDIANDTCLQGHVVHEEVIGNTMESESSEIVEADSIEMIEEEEVKPLKSVDETSSKPIVESTDFVENFEKNVQISDNLDASTKELILEDNSDSCVKVKEVMDVDVKAEANLTSPSTAPNPPDEAVQTVPIPETDQEVETKKSETADPPETGRRRSSRIRLNRWSDADIKVPPLVPMVPQLPSFQFLGLVASPPDTPGGGPDGVDKPVKVKSRWRRTSELEMYSGDGGGPPVPPPPPDPEVLEGLRQFQIIPQNVFLKPRAGNKKDRLVCECTLTREEIAKGEKGCGDDCLNRLLMIECGSRCILGALCSNRQFQNCQYAPCQVIKTEKKGFGLIASVNIPPGTFLMEYVGEVLESKEFRRRAKEYAKEKNAHYYFMQLESSHVIDATQKGNISRFINHSCDPNAETQKWTVNGELRIGFFSRRPITAGEEITFDYKLDRYGKEAQKCFCGAGNCSGWIGETPDEEEEGEGEEEKEGEEEEKEGGDGEKDEEEEKEPEKKSSTTSASSSSASTKKERKERKRKEEKRRDIISDREMEYEIEKLERSGVQNQKHTLSLSRLMVRAQDEPSRRRLLRLTQAADLRCMRLFLDYHGLSLIWSYMVDTSSSPQLKMDILNTLAILPIANKTILKDSKVMNVVKKWAKVPVDTSDSKDKVGEGEDSASPPTTEPPPEEQPPLQLTEAEAALEAALTEKAGGLLTSWEDLKEEYRIPKKERLEQMKEHEREANRGYSDPWESSSTQRTSESRGGYEKDSGGISTSRYRWERKRSRGEETGEETVDWRRSRTAPQESTADRHQNSRLTKKERRQLFALRVEEEERQRKLEDDWVKQQTLLQQQQQQVQQGPPPPGAGPPPLPPQQPQLMQPQPPVGFFPPPPPPHQAVFHPRPPDGGVVYGGCGPGFPPFLGPPGGPPGPYMEGPPPPGFPGGPPPPGPFPPAGPYSHPGGMGPGGPFPPPPGPYQPPPPFAPYNPPGPPAGYHPHPPLPGMPGPPPPGLLVPPASSAGPVPPHLTPLIGSGQQAPILLGAPPPPPPPPLPHSFPIKLPPKWRSAKDKQGRIYYYHTKTRKSQWQIPTQVTPVSQSDSDSESDESSEDEDSSSEEDEDEKEDEETEIGGFEGEEEVSQKEVERTAAVLSGGGEVGSGREESAASIASAQSLVTTPSLPQSLQTPPLLKKRREGLVSVNIISPRGDEESDYRCGIKKKQIRETKARLAREKKKQRASGAAAAAKCVADSSVARVQPKRKIKDLFRLQMANVVVAILNPYRKSDCKTARITNTEDFKYLARKLTHFVMVKEIKHCASVEELVCNDNVKHKARDFIRKYMSKFGPVYKRSSDE